MGDRVDAFGRAFAGSQLQIQTYVNRRQEQIDAAILSALPELASKGAKLEWVSPLEEERFAEYHDGAFLAALGLTEMAGILSAFWPQGGPHFDALARVHFADGAPVGALLVEAKSYPMEMYSDGCRASEPARTRIVGALEAARNWFGLNDTDWTGPLYQFANRLAHVYFLREIAKVPAWLVNVCFADDSHRPTPIPVWGEALESARGCLGFAGREIPFCADVILEAAGRELFQTPPRARNTVAALISASAGKEWRFLRNDRLGRHQFLAFANARGSSSLRYFDAATGLRLGDPRYGRGRSYQDAFRHELAASISVSGPGAVSIEQIPCHFLKAMRAAAGLTELVIPPATPTGRSSILAGVDEVVDSVLGISDVGQTAPHYCHLKAYRVLATRTVIDGSALVEPMYRRIVANWPGTVCRGRQNWRWEKQTFISDRNDSPEKQFEKAVAAQCPEWVNMIPVASGVLPDVDEGGRRIDLARRCGPGWYEFIELKLGQNCNTPLHAAIEILQHGLIYVFSRRYADRLGYDPHNQLLSAHRVSLKVLAPANSYSPGSLRDFQEEVSRGLDVLIAAELPSQELAMDFCFEQFVNEMERYERAERPCLMMAGRVTVY